MFRPVHACTYTDNHVVRTNLPLPVLHMGLLKAGASAANALKHQHIKVKPPTNTLLTEAWSPTA